MGAAAASINQSSMPVPAHSAMQLERVDSHLPRSWIGFAIAALGVVGEIIQYLKLWPMGHLVTATLLASFFGWLYWLFYVHRMHKVLAQATRCGYKVSPRRAVCFQLIPIFSWIWAVLWPNRMARFLKEAKPEMRVAVRWPGILMLIGVLLKFSNFRLFILFGVTAYLNRKIREVVVFNKAVRIARKQRLDLAMTAGLGAGFGLILCQAMQQFSQKPWLEQLRDVLVIVFSSFSHELLSAEISGKMWESVRTLSAMLIISGGITYAWSAGARRQRATQLGLLSGGGLAMLLILTLFIAFDAQADAVQNSLSSSVQNQLMHGTMGPAVVPWIIGAQVNSLSSVAIPLLLWSILGLVGGLAIDRNWGGGSIWHVAMSVLGAALIVILALWLANFGNHKQIVLGAAAVLGWCLSLLI